MKNKEISIVLQEYYNIVSPLLEFEDCDTIREIERKVLSFLCEVMGCDKLCEDCWELIDSAKCLQSFADGALLFSSDSCRDNIAFDIKMESLKENNINKVKKFIEELFIQELKQKANMGERNSCKLLATMSWLSVGVSSNIGVAQNIWSMLAVSGDWVSLDMLIYVYQSLNKTEAEMWKHVKEILYSEYESFSAIAQYSNYSDYLEEEVQLANLIMFVSQMKDRRAAKTIDRPMLHYVLNSGDDYKTKMVKLSSDTNYYLAMHVENKYANKEYGF